jgi:LysM repeat protein
MRELDRKDPLWVPTAMALGKLNTARLMSLTPFDDDQIYTIKKGDTLYGLGRKFKVAPDLLMRINRMLRPNRSQLANGEST